MPFSLDHAVVIEQAWLGVLNIFQVGVQFFPVTLKTVHLQKTKSFGELEKQDLWPRPARTT